MNNQMDKQTQLVFSGLIPGFSNPVGKADGRLTAHLKMHLCSAADFRLCVAKINSLTLIVAVRRNIPNLGTSEMKLA